MARCCPRESIPIEEDVVLSPLQRWRRYGVFPWQIVLHIVLVIFATVLVFSYNSVHGVVSRELGQNFQSTFFPTNYAQFNGDAADNPTFTRYFIFSIGDVAAGVDLLLESYWNLPQLANVPTAVALPQVPGTQNGLPTADTPVPGPLASIALPTVTWTRFDAATAELFDPAASPSLSTTAEVFTMTGPNQTWPTAGHNESDIRALLLRTVDLRYSLTFWAWDPAPDDNALKSRGCYVWQLEVVYDFHARGQIEVLWYLDAAGRCPTEGATDGWMVALVMLVALASAAQLLHSLVGAGLSAVACVRALHFQATEAAALGCEAGAVEGREESVPLLTAAAPIASTSPLAGPRRTGEVEMSATTPLRSTPEERTESSKVPSRAGGAQSNGGQFEGPSLPATLTLPPAPLRALDMLPLLRVWDALAMACETVLLSYCGSVLASAATGSGVDLSERGWQLPLAVAATGLWFATMRFLEYDPLFYAGVVTLEQALPEIARFFVGCAPLFIALGLFDLVVFWEVCSQGAEAWWARAPAQATISQEPRYSSPNMVFITLWATLSGDAIRETFQHTEDPTSPLRTLVANLQLASLLLLFTYVVVNCSVAIVEGKFFDAFSIEARDAALERRGRRVQLLTTIQSLLTRAALAQGPAGRRGLGGWS